MPVFINFAVTRESGQHLLMTKVLRPSLQLLGTTAELQAKPGQRLTEAVGIEVRKIGPFESHFEYAPDRIGVAPVRSLQTTG